MMTGEYKAIYPRLADYWDKPSAELPEDLHGVVERIFWAHGWDAETVEQRQQLVRNYDWNKDPAQEADTWYAMFNYAHADEDGLDASALSHRIAEARADKHPSVVLRLQDVADRLNGIAKNGDHWPGTEPLLWRELYRFNVVELKAMRSLAIDERDYSLELALKDVAEQLERILDIDRERVDDAVVAAIGAEIAQGASADKVDAAPVRIIRQRCDEILKWLSSNGYAPLMLPPPEKNGLSTVKAICRTELCQNKKMFSSRSLFDKAWQQLRDDNEVSESE